MEGFWERQLAAERARRLAEVMAGERALAEARAAEARRAAMARRQAAVAAQVAPVVQEAQRRSFWDRLPTGTPMVRPVEEQPTVEEFAAQLRPAGQLVSDVLFGPEVESVRPGTQQAGLLERFARTQAGEQEFRTAAERFGEGRPGSGLAWGLLGLAGAVPFFGDIAQGAAGVSRAVRGAEAAGDVARAVPRITVRADDVERVEGIGEHWFRVTDPDNPRGRMTLPGTSSGGRLGGRPMPIEEVPDEIYHVTTNAPGVRGAGVINVSGGANRGAGGTSGSGAVSTTASREVAETLQSDLRAFAELKNATTEEDVTRIILDAARSQGMGDEALLALGSEITATARAIRGQRAFDPEIHAKGLFDAWQYSRARLGGPRASVIIGDPFSDYWRSVRPEDIDIIPINKSQIPDGALINDYDVGRGGLEEIQVYADIPLAGDVARGAEVGRFGLQVSPLKVGADKARYTDKLTDLTDVVYREMPFDEFRVIRSDSGSGIGGRQIWVSNSPDFALGQGPWPKVLVEYDASVFGDVRPGNKPGWEFSWDAGLAEFLVRPDRRSGIREIDAVRSLIIPDETLATIKPWQLQSLSKDFVREPIEGGIKFTRKTDITDSARSR